MKISPLFLFVRHFNELIRGYENEKTKPEKAISFFENKEFCSRLVNIF